MLNVLAPGARLIDARTGDVLTGDALERTVDQAAADIAKAPPGLVVVVMANDVASVVRYLGALRAGRPVLVWGDAPLDDVVTRFRPALVSGPSTTVLGQPGITPHHDLALLLATSGSTGEPRLVRMSAAGMSAAVRAVRDSLAIGSDEVAITTLPPHFTYGLSVINSHLAAGATIVVESRGVLDQGFWESVDRYGVTTLAGVPHTFEVLARKPWTPRRNPSVRVLTAAGGRLGDELAARFHAVMAEHGGALYVMYGQTEAGPRICVLPPDRLPDKLGSVGVAVPGMRLSIEPTTGEVVCHGPSVMMGYATTAADLARGDDLGGVLHTGDQGHLDDDGFLWLTGRLGRTGKSFGTRVNLDSVEHLVADLAVAAAVAAGDRIRICCENVDAARLAAVRSAVAGRLGLHRLGVIVESVDRLPRRPNGKVDYSALSAALNGGATVR